MLATQTKTTTIALSSQDRMITVIIAALLGTFIVFGVAIAQPIALHNAAHDTRHAMTFPCH
ncbi:MAG: CbtB-domain containing protein [Roseicyclus sp.]|nr:CbtB-domain containing protein [Roseicyclus sp.]